jgi:anaerobic ribonucleoside-triphosphate reductase
MQKIIKRDGRIVEYDPIKITNAIWAAAKAAGGTDFNRAVYLTRVVETALDSKYPDEIVTVEQIQDQVEKTLVKSGHYKTAKAYIIYRKQHQDNRETQSLKQINNDVIEKYVSQNDWRINENSNMCFSLQGMNFHISGRLVEDYWMHRLYSDPIRHAHESGDIHIHDTAVLGPYCVGWDLQDLLTQGFRGVKGKIASKPPKHFRAALGQVVNYLYTLQGEAAGAQAFSNFDTLMAPFIFYDGLNYKQVKQAMQEFIFNLNVPTRVGFQSPFVNITMDITCPNHLKDTPAVVGGEIQQLNYSNFQEEMDMINRAFTEVMIEGDAEGRVFTFPIPTYNITEDFNWEDPKYTHIWEMTAKYGIPYFSNFVGSDMNPEDARSMCPLHPDTKVIVKSNKHNISIRSIKDVYYQRNAEYEVLHNGQWYPASVVSISSEGCTKVKICNGSEVIFDIRHEQPIKTGKGSEIQIINAKKIEPEMWLPFNAIPIEDERDNYTAGYAAGAYVGDGSIDKGAVIYSLNTDKKIPVKDALKSFFISTGFTVSESNKDNLLSLRIGCSGTAAENWIRQYVEGDRSGNKKITARAFKMGQSFLKGILDGWYATDGGNKGRIYTSSVFLMEDFQTLCSLLGIAYKIEPDNPDTREGRLSTNPVYTLKFHSRDSYKNHFFYEDGYYWFRVTNTELMSFDNKVFCFAVNSRDKLFQLANGLVTHNCRLRLDNRELQKRGGGLFGANPLTGSIGVVTINMPRLGFLSENKGDFFSRLGLLMDIASQSLEIKRKVLENFTDQGLYPYTKHYLKGVKQATGQYWTNHFSTIGLVGMNEACLNLLGVNIADSKGHIFAIETLNFMRERIKCYQQKTGNLYNLEATPAEGCSYSLLLKDKKCFGKFKVPYLYYSNSTQLPVKYTDDLFDALFHQESLQELYTGGTVFHVFLGESPDGEAVKRLLQKMVRFRIPYYSITPSFSVCENHGYLKGEQFTCPDCGEETEVYSRVVGYLRPIKQYNKGKQKEAKDRKKYDTALSMYI